MRQRRTLRGTSLVLGVAGLCLAVPASVGAQQQNPDSAAAKRPAAPPELVFEREVFTYPNIRRRNPFGPLTGTENGPRFEQLRLMATIYDANNPSASLAMIGTSTVRTSTDSTNVSVTPRGQSWYLRVGGVVGSVRVAQIFKDSVVVEVAQFGITERKVMRLETRGGTQ